jgi:threonyl-tRNA synthetase
MGRSGHWENYKDNMYFTRIDDVDFAVKPMNCPGGTLIYKSDQHSYRDLPLRLAELGLVHRHEMSGVLHGLFRVRLFTQDDAHIYCLPEQVEDEVLGVIELVRRMYRTFGFERVHVELSTRPEKSIGSDEMWQTAEGALAAALERAELPYTLNPGDGAFYGPKIDFHIEDVMGRTWQCATCQVDFAMPERLDLDYVGEDNQRHRPVMIHRTVLGSIERFLAILIEHYGGALPAWLAPVQGVVVPVADRHAAYAGEVRLRSCGSRSTCGPSLSRRRSAMARSKKCRSCWWWVIERWSSALSRCALEVAKTPSRSTWLKRSKSLPVDAACRRAAPRLLPRPSEQLPLLERRRLLGYTPALHKEEATLPTPRLIGAGV